MPNKYNLEGWNFVKYNNNLVNYPISIVHIREDLDDYKYYGNMQNNKFGLLYKMVTTESDFPNTFDEIIFLHILGLTQKYEKSKFTFKSIYEFAQAIGFEKKNLKYIKNSLEKLAGVRYHYKEWYDNNKKHTKKDKYEDIFFSLMDIKFKYSKIPKKDKTNKLVIKVNTNLLEEITPTKRKKLGYTMIYFEDIKKLTKNHIAFKWYLLIRCFHKEDKSYFVLTRDILNTSIKFSMKIKNRELNKLYKQHITAINKVDKMYEYFNLDVKREGNNLIITKSQTEKQRKREAELLGFKYYKKY